VSISVVWQLDRGRLESQQKRKQHEGNLSSQEALQPLRSFLTDAELMRSKRDAKAWVPSPQTQSLR
jgi:hypothetical protein